MSPHHPFPVVLFGSCFSGAHSVENFYYTKSTTKLGLHITWDLNADFSFIYGVARAFYILISFGCPKRLLDSGNHTALVKLGAVLFVKIPKSEAKSSKLSTELVFSSIWYECYVSHSASRVLWKGKLIIKYRTIMNHTCLKIFFLCSTTHAISYWKQIPAACGNLK